MTSRSGQKLIRNYCAMYPDFPPIISQSRITSQASLLPPPPCARISDKTNKCRTRDDFAAALSTHQPLFIAAFSGLTTITASFVLFVLDVTCVRAFRPPVPVDGVALSR